MKEILEGPIWARLLGIMKTLVDPVRLSIVLSTINAPKTYRELMVLTRKSKSQISKHTSLLKKLELVEMKRKERQVYIKTTRLAIILLQTLKGVILQNLNQQTEENNKPFGAGTKDGVTIPICNLHSLLRDRAHFLDLLLLTAQTTEHTYWHEISELLLLAKQYGLELDIVRLPVPLPKKP